MDESDKSIVPVDQLPPSLEKYMFPSEEMRKAVTDLEIFWQLSNQSGVKLYQKWQGKTNFVLHNLRELWEYIETKELFDTATGDHWTYLNSAIDYMERYSDHVDMTGFNKMSREHQMEVLNIINNGQDAYEKIKKWTTPLDKKKCLEAIKSGVKLGIGNSTHDTINILKLCATKSISNEEGGIGLFPNVLEIESTESMIDYFRYLPKAVPDSLIVAFLKDKKYKTPHIYLYLVYKNNFYVLNTDELNLNQSYAIGIRTPERYERWYHFGNIWMPFFSIMKKTKESKSTQITLREKKIIQQRPLLDIFCVHPEFKVWLEMVTYRVIHYFKKKGSEIMLGYTPEDVVKLMLEDKTKTMELETNVPLKYIRHYSGEKEEKVSMGKSFSSHRDSISYLMEKFKSQLTAVVPSIQKLPVMMGTTDHIQNVIAFEQRKLVAKQLQSIVDRDYKKNHVRVYKWIKDYVKKYGVDKIIKKGLLDKEYSVLHHRKWSEDYTEGEETVGGVGKKKVPDERILKKKILTIRHHRDSGHIWHDERFLDIFSWKVKRFYESYHVRNSCNLCGKYQFFYAMELEFIDYRQLLEFFELKEKDLPIEYIQHFHGQNMLASENHISDDDDPVYMVQDPYFRIKKGDDPAINLHFGLCKRCFKQTIPQSVLEQEKAWHIRLDENK